MSSPVHQPGRAARWTTANIDEGLPGVVTPLTWSFYFPAVEEATRAAWFGLGAMTRAERPVPAEVDGRFFTVVFGRGAANVDRFGEMADRMPGASAAAFEMQLFGSSADAPSSALLPTLRRAPFVAARAAPTVRRAMRAFAPLATETDAWWRRAVRAQGDGHARLAEARARFAPVLNVHLVLTMVCQGLLERVAAVAAGAGLPGLERELIKSAGGTAEFELVADLRRLADEQIDMAAFLDRHGYHGAREGLLDAVSWREDPAPIEALAERYAKRGWPESPAELVARRTAEQADALRRLEAALGPVRAAPARALIRFAAHAPEWRETGRSTILKVVDAGRAAAHSLEGDPFMFTVGEARDAGLAAERRAQYEHHATLELPHVWRGVPDPVQVEPAEPALALDGLGVSSGVAEGIARVVHDQDTAELEEGDILVCRVTDPSWASLFPLAEAVVTDVGSAMSHAAIVCRELGIPCVASTRDGTRRIPDGARIRVDGTNGKVQVL